MKNKCYLSVIFILIINIGYSQLTEDFEGSTFPPSDWSLIKGKGDIDKSSQTSDHTSGTGSFARYDCYNINGSMPAYLQTPRLIVSSTDKDFSFWTKYYLLSGTYGSLSSLYVDVSVDSGVTWVSGTTNYINNMQDSGWKLVSLDLTNFESVNFTGDKTYVRFKTISDYGSYNIAIDDISGPTVWMPSCPKTGKVTTNIISSDSVSLSWTYMSSPIEFDYEYGLSGFVLGTGTKDTTVLTSDTITGLLPNTTYDVYFRVLCAVNDTSLVSGPYSFTTPCKIISTFPFLETFNDTSSSEICWEILNNNGDGDAWIMHSVGHSYGGTNESAGIYTDGTGGSNDDYLISPKFLLNGNQRIKFHVRARKSTDPNDFHVVLSSTGTAATDFSTIILKDTVYSTSYVEKEIDLSAYSGEYYIAFKIPLGGLDGYVLNLDQVLVENIPVCPKVKKINLSALSIDSVKMSWNYGVSPIAFEYEYGPTGFAFGSEIKGTTSLTSDTISGLSANTSYDVYFKVFCAVGDTSELSGPFSFSTSCNPIATFPYTENFDGSLTNGVWNCWKVIDAGREMFTWRQAGFSSTAAHSGTKMAYGSGNDNDYLISPQFIVGADSIRIRFWDIVEDVIFNNVYTIRVSTSGSDSSDFTDSITTINCTNTTWQEHIIDLSAYTNQTIYIAFHQIYSGATVYGFGIDDFKVEKVPTCPEPATFYLGVDSVTSNSVEVHWKEEGTATSWRLEYGKYGFKPGFGTSLIVTNDTFSLTGLSPLTVYQFRVKSLCSTSDSSDWSGYYGFATFCKDTVLGPWTEDVELHLATKKASEISTCWNSNNTGQNYEWNISDNGKTGSPGTGANSAHSGLQFFYTEATGSSVGDTAILISPYIDLSSMTTPFLEFYTHMYGIVIGVLNVEVYNGTSWVSEKIISGSQQALQNSAWDKHYVDLSSYSGVVKFRFVAVGNGSYEGDICLDDISVVESPSCFSPDNIKVFPINDSATIVWGQTNGNPSKWIIEYGVSGFNIGSGMLDSSVNKSVGINGLNSSTQYEFYLRSYCGVGDTADRLGPFLFKTKCSPDIPTYVNDFTTFLPSCWMGARGRLEDSTTLIEGLSYWEADGFANVGTTGAVSMNIYSTNMKEWLLSSPIDLGDGTVPYQVEFDVALTDFHYSNSDTMGIDDTLALVISTDYGLTWSKANVLRAYTRGDQPSNSGNREFFDLSAYSGVVKFGFYALSTIYNTDYDVHIDNFRVTNLCVPSRDTVTGVLCFGDYTSSRGKIYSTAGFYSDTIQKVRGCDSILVINLVDNRSVSTISPIVCDSIISPSGLVHTVSGIFTDTILNSVGCDSLITVNLTVNHKKLNGVNKTVCDTYTRPGGMLATTSGTFYDTLITVAGCDSIIVTSLVVNYSSTSTLTDTGCISYISPSGKIWTTSGTRKDTIPNAKGCDSVITINLRIEPISVLTRVETVCNSYTVPETGNVYTVSGTYFDTVSGSSGCVIITTNLTVNTISAGVISVSGVTLTCLTTGVDYKWLDCDNGNSFITGETNQTFIPINNGSYACVVTSTAGCVDTSDCETISNVSLEEYVIKAKDISVSPNPAKEYVIVNILKQNSQEDIMVILNDVQGKIVHSRIVNSLNNTFILELGEFQEGIYTLTFTNDFFYLTKKLSIVK